MFFFELDLFPDKYVLHSSLNLENAHFFSTSPLYISTHAKVCEKFIKSRNNSVNLRKSITDMFQNAVALYTTWRNKNKIPRFARKIWRFLSLSHLVAICLIIAVDTLLLMKILFFC